MKNFDSHRFKMVLAKDLRSSWPLFRTSFLIICAIPVVFWLFNLVLGDTGRTEFSPLFRRITIYVTMILIAIMAPSRIYRTVNLPNEGIYYAMLPASRTEKFWSQILTCYILIPLSALLAGIIIDLLLTLLPFGAYVDWIWHYWPSLTDETRLMENLGIQKPLLDIFGNFWMMFIGYVSFLLSYAALFFFTNTLFKKNKVAKTFLWIILIGFVLNIIATPISLSLIHNIDSFDLIKRFASWIERNPHLFFRLMYWSSIVLNAIEIAVFSWWGGRRLKKMAY
ncbi:MAG: hypothetical protein SPJ13_02800 [Bacteroidales bacterium]|nr:hypothetical protein [Bacteroidales bacterium]